MLYLIRFNCANHFIVLKSEGCITHVLFAVNCNINQFQYVLQLPDILHHQWNAIISLPLGLKGAPVFSPNSVR